MHPPGDKDLGINLRTPVAPFTNNDLLNSSMDKYSHAKLSVG